MKGHAMCYLLCLIFVTVTDCRRGSPLAQAPGFFLFQYCLWYSLKGDKTMLTRLTGTDKYIHSEGVSKTDNADNTGF